MNKIILSCMVSLGVVTAAGMTSFAAGDVAISEDNFPDQTFREYVADTHDQDFDGVLTEEEISCVEVINVYQMGIEDLTGIEFFTSLTELACEENELTSIDVSSLTSLKELDCAINHLEQLDLSKNESLTRLICFENELEELDLSDNTELTEVNCSENRLTKLDISECKRLNMLDCYTNKLQELDVSNNTALTELYVGENQLSELDISKNTKLTDLWCSYNKLSKLDVSANTALKGINCYGNDISELDLSHNTQLNELWCYKNPMTVIDISPCAILINLYKTGTKSVVSAFDGYKFIQYEIEDKASMAIDQDDIVLTAKPTATPTAKPTTQPTVTPIPKVTTDPSVSLSLDKDTASVICGKTMALKATLTGSSSQVEWTSSDPKIATVDKNGKVTGKTAGAVSITASAAGARATCAVTVLYKDVTKTKDFWFEPTNYLTAKGVVKGYDKQTKFKPANKCTRAQMVTFIWRLVGEPEPKTATCKFSDVKTKDYFYKACLWGNENGIVEGYKNGTFGPQIVCARKHAVTFLWRLAGKPDPKSSTCKFKDVKKKDYFYKPAIWASENKILAGYKDGTFRPEGDCLRRQMVTFLYKYDKFVNINK